MANELYDISKNVLQQKEQKNLYWVKDLRNIMNECYDADFDVIFEKHIKFLSNWARVEICPISSFFLNGIRF